MKTKRNVLEDPLLKECLVLDQLWSVYTKYVSEAVRDRQVQIHGTAVALEGCELLIPV